MPAKRHVRLVEVPPASPPDAGGNRLRLARTGGLDLGLAETAAYHPLLIVGPPNSGKAALLVDLLHALEPCRVAMAGVAAGSAVAGAGAGQHSVLMRQAAGPGTFQPTDAVSQWLVEMMATSQAQAEPADPGGP